MAHFQNYYEKVTNLRMKNMFYIEALPSLKQSQKWSNIFFDGQSAFNQNLMTEELQLLQKEHGVSKWSNC